MLASVVGSVVLTAGMTHSAVAGETIKFHSQHINVSVKWESIEVPDQPGHVVGMFAAKGLGVRRSGPPEPPYKIEIWGTGDYRKDGTGADHGYGRFTFSDGSSYDEEWSGKVSGGRDVGTAVYSNGTGRFKGMKGGSKFDCQLFGDRFICEVDGTIELP
jgi:hypothetical protein